MTKNLANEQVSAAEQKSPSQEIGLKAFINITMRKREVLMQERHIGNDVKSLMADFAQIAEMAITLERRQDVQADVSYLRKKSNSLNLKLVGLSTTTLEEMQNLLAGVSTADKLADKRDAYYTLCNYVKTCVSKVATELKKIG